MSKDDFLHAAIVSNVVDEAAVHDAECYDGGRTLAELNRMFEILTAADEPTAPTRAVCIGGRNADAGAIMLLQVPPDFGFRVGDAYEVSPVNRQAEPTAECPHCREVYEIWANTEGFTPVSRRVVTKYTKGGALMTLLTDSDGRLTHSSYKRCIDACEALGLDHEETHRVLRWFGYTNADGHLRDWAASPRKKATSSRTVTT